jgi:hypothetical protein
MLAFCFELMPPITQERFHHTSYYFSVFFTINLHVNSVLFSLIAEGDVKETSRQANGYQECVSENLKTKIESAQQYYI